MVIKKGVTPEEISRSYPVLFHMAEADTWESIKRHGLRSTSALLDLFRVNGTTRKKIEKEHRPKSVTISNRSYGQAVIRDQEPMTDADLTRCLISMRPADWYRTLNRHVFFWPTKKRLSTMLNAKNYKSLTHTVLTLDTARMLADHLPNVRLTALNSGCTKPIARPRGKETFMTMNRFPFEDRRKKYGKANAVAEVAIQYAVPNIERYVISVDLMMSDELLENIYLP